MTWTSIGASAIGSSHTKVNTPCQDHEIHDSMTIAGHECFYCFASDGAGTAKYSKAGATLCCNAAEQFIVDNFKFDIDINDALVIKLVKYIIGQLHKTSAESNIPLREFSCTFLGAIFYQDTAVFFQIGDGVILINHGNENNLELIFWPDNGEFLNTTYFVGEPNSIEHLRFKIYNDTPIHEVAVLTDGLQMICLDYANKKAHQPFFRPLFNVLKQADNPEKVKILHRKLNEFLSGEQVNSRTDDDKTLILATFK